MRDWKYTKNPTFENHNLMKILTLLTLSLLMLSIKCEFKGPKPSQPKLPPITTTGENTFGCLINGELWLPKGSFPNVPALTADWNNGGFSINANRKTDVEFSTVKLDGFTFFQPKKLHLTGDTANTYFANGYCEYHRDSTLAGEINLLYLDTINRIMSGTFWFKASASGCETIEVTDGRFDINY